MSEGLEGHNAIVSFSFPLIPYVTLEVRKTRKTTSEIKPEEEQWLLYVPYSYKTIPNFTSEHYVTLQTTIPHLHRTQRLIITDGFFGGWFAATAEVIEDVTINLFSAYPLHCQPCWKNERFFTITCHIIYFLLSWTLNVLDHPKNYFAWKISYG